MSDDRLYPDEPAGPYPVPPETFEDYEGREIVIRPFEADDEEPLVDMYLGFNPSDRAQGIPPSTEPRIRNWLGIIIEEGYSVLAEHDDEVVGHATLVEDSVGDAYELAIFVTQAYQRAGIGGRLIRNLLGHGRDSGIERVWLTVERWNTPAVSLYEDVGFERCGTESFELEMALRLN